MNKPEVSVIVCTYNRQAYLKRCLQSLLHQTMKPERYEVILVNNNSSDNTAEVYKKFIEEGPAHNFNYILEERQGLSYARNTGIEAAKGHVVSFVDDDAFANPDFIQNLYQFYESHPDVSATGGKIEPEFEGNIPKWVSPYMMTLFAALDMGDEPRKFKGTKFPIGANMAFKKEIFNTIGLFNTNLGRKGSQLYGGEEKDIFNRIRLKKLPIHYVPSAAVVHIIPENRTTKDYIKRQAIGIGVSEKIRVSSSGKIHVFKKVTNELIKWVASIVLCLGYLFSVRLQAGIMLIKFRYWVAQGYLSAHKTSFDQ